MKKLISTLALFSILLCVISCTQTKSGALFNGNDTSGWAIKGDVSVKDNALVLKGSDAQAVFKNGKYKNFELSLELRTINDGKGHVGFHTNTQLSKGYDVAINNDREDPTWWKMSGSLLSVRNLTKSAVKDSEWFTMNIKVEGQDVKVYVNGEPVVEYIEPAAPYRIAPNTNALLSEGTFSLVSTGNGEIQFRNVTVNVIEGAVDIQSQLAEATNEQNDDIIRLHQENFPVLDYHVHLKGGLTNESAAQQSRKYGINYAMAPNCGIGFDITNDAEVMEFLNKMRSAPFILAMQGEGREWVTTFSSEVRNEFDYVFSDALTFHDRKGRRTRLWVNEEVVIENEQDYMDLIVEKTCEVMNEPIAMLVNPCFLPDQLNDRYDEFWTEERMDKVVAALVKTGKVLEINNRYEIPNKALIQKAKDAGVKFTFGTNNGVADFGKLEYCIRMKEECGITAEDMYKPNIKL